MSKKILLKNDPPLQQSFLQESRNVVPNEIIKYCIYFIKELCIIDDQSKCEKCPHYKFYLRAIHFDNSIRKTAR